MADQWQLPRYLVDSIARSESPADAEDNFQTCVALSGAVADIWLSADADAAREHALQLVNERLQLDSAQFDQVLARIGEALPDISALFETTLISPFARAAADRPRPGAGHAAQPARNAGRGHGPAACR